MARNTGGFTSRHRVEIDPNRPGCTECSGPMPRGEWLTPEAPSVAGEYEATCPCCGQVMIVTAMRKVTYTFRVRRKI